MDLGSKLLKGGYIGDGSPARLFMSLDYSSYVEGIHHQGLGGS